MELRILILHPAAAALLSLPFPSLAPTPAPLSSTRLAKGAILKAFEVTTKVFL